MEQPLVRPEAEEGAVPQAGRRSAAPHRVRATRAAVLATAVALAIVVVPGTVLYALGVRALDTELRESLERTACIGAALVDVELHESLVDPAQEGGPDYARAIAPLATLLEGHGELAYIYTVVLRDDHVRFVLDPTPEGDADGDGVDDKSHLLEQYDDPDPEMMETLTTGVPKYVERPYEDQWGTFVSGYAPLRAADGRLVGALGVDLHVEQHLANLARMRQSAVTALAVALAVAIAVGGVTRRLAERAARAEAHADRLVGDLRRACSSAEAAARDRAEFLAVMSHEIRTPMNGVLGLSALLLDDPLAPEQRERAELIVDSTRRLLRVVDEVLEYSRLDAHAVELEYLPFPPSEVVEGTVELLAGMARPDVDVTVQVDDDVPAEVVGDSGRIRQVLVNLVGNAIKFTERGEVALHVSVARSDERATVLRFAVRDDGRGIAPETRARLFRSYSQADASTVRTHGGSGLGLVIAQRLVELMGGTLTLDSELGRGSTFAFEIPLVPEGTQTEGEARREAWRAFAGRRVLVLEPRAAARRSRASQLASAGLAFVEADGPDAAREAVRAARVDLAVASWSESCAPVAIELAERGVAVVGVAAPGTAAPPAAAGILRACRHFVRLNHLLPLLTAARARRAA